MLLNEKRILAVFKNSGFTPFDIHAIRSSLSEFVHSKKLGVRLSNIRVSNLNIQVDIFIVNNDDTTDFVRRVFGEWMQLIDVVDLSVDHYSAMSYDEIIRRAIELFNEERFWEFHEAVEALWRSEPQGPRKELLQGLILIAAALVHAQKGRPNVGLSILERGLRKLEALPPGVTALPQINLEEFVAQVKSIISKRELTPFKLAVKPN